MDRKGRWKKVWRHHLEKEWTPDVRSKQPACQAVFRWAQKQLRKLHLHATPFPLTRYIFCQPQTLFTTCLACLFIFYPFDIGFSSKITSMNIQFELMRQILSKTTCLKVNWEMYFLICGCTIVQQKEVMEIEMSGSYVS